MFSLCRRIGLLWLFILRNWQLVVVKFEIWFCLMRRFILWLLCGLRLNDVTHGYDWNVPWVLISNGQQSTYCYVKVDGVFIPCRSATCFVSKVFIFIVCDWYMYWIDIYEANIVDIIYEWSNDWILRVFGVIVFYRFTRCFCYSCAAGASGAV